MNEQVPQGDPVMTGPAVQGEAVKPEPMAQGTAASTGMDPKVAGLLCWVFLPVSSIIFLVLEKDDKFVKFHAYQSLLAGIALIVASTIASALVVVLIGLLLIPIVSIAGLVVWLLGMVKAYNGEMWKLPVIGDMAEEYANK